MGMFEKVDKKSDLPSYLLFLKNDSVQVHNEIPISVFQESADATYVYKKVVLPETIVDDGENIIKMKLSANRLLNKYKSVWKKSNIDQKTVEKMFEMIPRLNLVCKNFDENNYESPEEQIVDRMLLLFANECSLDSTLCKPYGGLFQLASDTVDNMKKWAKKHPELFPDGLNYKFNSPKEFASNLSPSEQLEWLVAYIGSKGKLETSKTVDELAGIIKTCSAARAKNVLDATERTNAKAGLKHGTKYVKQKIPND